MRQPGIEPGSIAWKATMLTIIPLTLCDGVTYTVLGLTRAFKVTTDSALSERTELVAAGKLNAKEISMRNSLTN